MNVALKELLELIDFGFLFGKGLSDALEDNQIRFDDYSDFLPAFLAAPEAFNGLDELKGQFKVILNENLETVLNHIDGKLDLTNDLLEYLIEDTLDFAANGYRLGYRWAKYINRGDDPVVA